MLDKLKEIISAPIMIEKKGRGEWIKFHSYRIYKNGIIKDCYGNPVNPEVIDGVAYISIPLAPYNEKKEAMIEVGRIVYSQLVEEISIVGTEPKIHYKDGDGTNFKVENLDIENGLARELAAIDLPALKSEMEDDGNDDIIDILDVEPTKKMLDIEDVIELDDEILDLESENDEEVNNNTNLTVEEIKANLAKMANIAESGSNQENERLIREINQKAAGLLDSNFAEVVNAKMSRLQETIDQLKSMREMDSVAYQNKTKELHTQIEQLKLLINEKDNNYATLLNQNQALLNERANIEQNMVVLSKDTFFTMYKTMEKVLSMVEKINK